MKIKLKVGISYTEDHYTIELDELDQTEESWNQLSGYEKSQILQSFVNELPESPSWILESYYETS